MRVIVAVGGDGTINRVLNGFYDERGNRISDASLGVLHTGTSPDFCKSYSIPCQLDQALDHAFRRLPEKDPGREDRPGAAARIRPSTRSPFRTTVVFHARYFACCANIGLGRPLPAVRTAESGNGWEMLPARSSRS